jgi:Family of unknown function (DUF6353)
MQAKWAEALTTFTRKYSPEILSGLAVTGVITTAVLAVRATPEALVRTVALRGDRAGKDPENPAPVTRMDMIRACWTLYIPSALSAAGTIACIAGASRIGSRRNAVLVAGMALADRAFQEYRDEVKEVLGERKELSVREKIAQKQIEANPAGQQVIITGGGEQLCYDTLTGRYFRSDIETIRRAENEINHAIIHDLYASQNDFCALIGLPDCVVGEELGWNVDHLLNLIFTSHLTEEGIPCLAIAYEKLPVAKYGQTF